MAKRLPVEQQIADLVALLDQPVTEELTLTLRTALLSKQSLVAAKAADVAGTLSIAALQPDLEASFARLMLDPTKNDKGCIGKISIAAALQKMALPAEATFLVGIKHVQLEAIWGGESDTAVTLRGLCAFGLVQMGYARVMPMLVDLLTDPASEARIGAVQALSATGQESASLLLRLKVLIGDTEPNVIAECLTGLMKLFPKTAVDFVAGFLSRPDSPLAEAAAIALGESRTVEGLEVLKTHYREGLTRANRRIVLQAMALVRLPEAIETLVEIVRADDVPAAVHAIEALALYRRDEHVRTRLHAITQARGEPALVETMREWANPSTT